ncbi:SREBP regulating gene protein isoform X2 [Eschrichtius robustus]|uniref:SREBP regulating gene protein isoform X2 n=1 Tax=Eschrichtius robustus TaxID=9764 RepID=UPI0035C02074
MPPGPRACPAPRRDGEPGGHGVAAAPAEEEERAVRDRNLLQVQDHNQPIPWKVQFNLGNSSRPSNQCRNSIQGKHLITDELGYVCERKDLLVNGCCNVNVPGTKQYCCDGCLSNGCCSAYEYCVSCCLQPNKQLLLERFLNRAAVAFQNLFMAVEDHFELCLAKCRTSSQMKKWSEVTSLGPMTEPKHDLHLRRRVHCPSHHPSPAPTLTHL